MSNSAFEALLTQVENVSLEKDNNLIQDILFDIERQIKGIGAKKLKLSAEEISTLSLVIEEKRSTHRPTKSNKSKNNKAETIPDDYYNYAFDTEEFVLEDKRPDWQSLNKSNLPYPQWLVKEGLPQYFPMPDSSLYPVIACLCLTNSAAIPGMLPGLAVQPELPMVWVFGNSGNGKSTFVRWIGNHYEWDDDVELRAFQEILSSSSLNSFRDAVDRASHLGEARWVREAMVHIDNFKPVYLKPGGIWSRGIDIFMAVQRSQAVTKVSGNGKRKTDDLQTKFETWALKVFSSIHHPKELFTYYEDFPRRFLPIPFDCKAQGNLGAINWLSVRDEYVKLWNPKDRKEIFIKKILFPLLTSDTSYFKSFPDQLYVPTSLTLISVGVYAGIFKDVSDAIVQVGKYWEYVLDRLSYGTEDFLTIALEQYVSELEEQAIPKKSTLGTIAKYVEVSLDELLLKCSQQGSREKEAQKVQQLMRLHGYKMSSVKQGGKFVSKFVKFF